MKQLFHYRLHLKSLNKSVFLSVLKKFKYFFKVKKINTKLIILPLKIKKYCVLSSPHIDKDAREQFEIRIYKAFFDFEISKLNSFKELIHLEIPSGLHLTFSFIN